MPALVLRVPAGRALVVRVRAARLRAGHVACLCSIRWTSLVNVTVYYCRTYAKAVRGGESEEELNHGS